MGYKKGDIIKGVVSGITEYGIFVRIDDKYDGLIHISEISERFVRDPNQYVNLNEVINVEIIDIDRRDSKMKLSIKNIEYKGDGKNVKKIVETPKGFTTLQQKLPIWIEENLKRQKNNSNFVDK